MKVIAFGVELAKERGEGDKLRLEPKPLSEFRPKRFKEYYEKKDEGMSSSEEEDESEEEQEQKPVDDGWNEVGTTNTRRRNRGKEEQVIFKPKEE